VDQVEKMKIELLRVGVNSRTIVAADDGEDAKCPSVEHLIVDKCSNSRAILVQT
jgi:hypothetical protein